MASNETGWSLLFTAIRQAVADRLIYWAFLLYRRNEDREVVVRCLEELARLSAERMKQ